MRPTKIRKAAKTLRRVIDKSRAVKTLESYTDDEISGQGPLLEVSNYIARNLGNLDEDTAYLSEMIGMDRLGEAEFWKPLIVREIVHQDALGEKLAEVRAIQNMLKTLSALLSPAEAHKPSDSPKESFTLILPDTNEARRASDVRNTLEAFENLYDVCQILEHIGEDDNGERAPLEVTTVETGSELAFIFLGAAPAILATGAILFTVWDRIQFREERALEQQMDTVLRSLDTMEEIEEKRDTLGDERAESMKSDIFRSMRAMLTNGAIPEDNQDAHQDTARQLASENTRALPEADTPESNEENQ